MEFSIKGKVILRVNNDKRETKTGKPYSWDYIVVEQDGIDFWGKPAVFQYPVKIWNDNKTAAYKGDIEVGDMINVRVNLECSAWNGDVQVREFTNKDGFTQKNPSLFIDLMCMDITGHVKGKVAENVDFNKSISEESGEGLPDIDDSDLLPF